MRIWLELERVRVPNDSGIAGAIDHGLNHWAALTEHLSNIAMDNNHYENQIRL